jgi:hypothetical protein
MTDHLSRLGPIEPSYPLPNQGARFSPEVMQALESQIAPSKGGHVELIAEQVTAAFNGFLEATHTESVVPSQPIAKTAVVTPPQSWNIADLTGREQLLQLKEAIQRNFPMAGSANCMVHFVQERDAIISTDEMRLEIKDFAALQKRIQQSQKDELETEREHEKKLARMSKITAAKTAMSAFGTCFKLAAGTGLFVGGQPLVGGALVLSSAVTMANEIMRQLGHYQTLAESFGGDEQQVEERGEALQKYVSLLDFTLSLATLCMGGTSGLSSAFEVLKTTKVSSEGIGMVSTAAQAPMLLLQARTEKEIGKLRVKYRGIDLDLTIQRSKREERQDQVQILVELLEKSTERSTAIDKIHERTDRALLNPAAGG